MRLLHPGQICSAIGMFDEFQDGLPSAVTKDIAASRIEFSDEEIKERMSGISAVAVLMSAFVKPFVSF